MLMSKTYTLLRMAALAAVSIATLAACVTTHDRISRRESDLAASGFVVKVADTTERRLMLSLLPPNRFVQRKHEDEIHYVYADPVVCKCLYVGTEQAYGAFRKLEADQRLADEQEMTAQMYSDPAWRWGPWGPWGADIGFHYGPSGW
jgi:hypothetical protein